MAATDNLPLRDLQKVILGQRVEPLSSIEMKILFSYPTTPELILYIINAFNQNKLDPNITLVLAIAGANAKQDLVLIGLASRHGADPNLYVNVPSVGDIHILAYAYLALSQKALAVLNAVVIMLMAMGSDPNRPVFDVKGGIIKDEYSLVEPIKGHSILEWLEDQGYDTIIPQISGQNYQDVEKEFMTTLAVFLDDPQLLPAGITPRLDEVVGSHSELIFNLYADKANPQAGLRVSRDYLNLVAYEKYVDLGATMNYGEINNMILSIGVYKQQGDFISMGQVKDMFIYPITYGVVLDEYQMALIEQTDEALMTRVKEIYEKPYWTKVCITTKGPIGDKMKRLAYQLNLHPEVPKETLCHQLRMITQADPELVKESAVTRQKVRIRSDVAYINQFDAGDIPPPIEINNRSVISDNLYDFPDADIGYYRDHQDILWCFTSNNFLKMVERKTNPYTNQPFPTYFVDEIERKIKFISTYRSIDDIPTPISETIDNLSKPDQPDNTYTDRYVAEFDEMLISHDVMGWNIKNLTNDELETILEENFDVSVNLSDLDRTHAEKTFSVVAYEELRNTPDLAKMFFKRIQEKSTNKKYK